MGITFSGKETNTSNIACGGSFKLKLSLTAAPDIVSNPTDIVLILDRSGSMTGSALANLKSGAKKFIDIIDEATDSSQDGNIGGGSRIGIVSFSTTATQDTQLITSVSDLKDAVDALNAGGSTNHEDAFEKAVDLLFDGSTNKKVMVMFTDGFTTAGGNPVTITDAAKANGVVIYVIGLSGTGGIDVNALNSWASTPTSSFVVITPDDAELESIFENLAKNISKPGAENILVRDIVNPCFQIVSVTSPSKGTATMINHTTIEWRIDELGTTASEGAVLEFDVKHVGSCSGEVEVNESVTYSDDTGNVVVFPSPNIEVECDIVVNPEGCPVPVDFSIDGCEDSVELDAGSLAVESLGRILMLDVTVRNVCPGKRVALAVIVNELDAQGNEYKRGMKTFVIPAHNRSVCQDVTVRCVKFVLPEELDVAAGSSTTICNERRFRARFITHYIDNDFECCSDV